MPKKLSIKYVKEENKEKKKNPPNRSISISHKAQATSEAQATGEFITRI